MNTYPRLTDFEPRAFSEDRMAYGWRALKFVLATGRINALDAEGQEQALYVSASAVRSPDISGPALSTLADVRKRLLIALQTVTEAPEPAQEQELPDPPKTPPSKVPVLPPRPKLPPLPTCADPF